MLCQRNIQRDNIFVGVVVFKFGTGADHIDVHAHHKHSLGTGQIQVTQKFLRCQVVAFITDLYLLGDGNLAAVALGEGLFGNVLLYAREYGIA